MKKIITVIFILLILILNTLASCAKSEKYGKVEYPEQYTPEYCAENYVDADQNLVPLYIDNKDGVGPISVSDGYDTFYAIKDIPFDKYLFASKWQLLSTHTRVVQNKNMELPEQEILSYQCKSVDLFWKKVNNSSGGRFDKWSSPDHADQVSEHIATLNSEEATMFQTYIRECLNTGNYVESGKPNSEFMVSSVWKENMDSGLAQNWLCLRVSFVEYENLVWEVAVQKAVIKEAEERYYMTFFWFITDEKHPDGYWKIVYIPLNESLAGLIPKSE